MSHSRRRARPDSYARGTTAVPSRQPAERGSAVGGDQLARYLAERAWGIGLVALVIVIAIHLGALDWRADVPFSNADGTTQRLPNTFASIDHPFHISKESAVLAALRHGEFPRWISSHQAGYPVEFYPLGGDLLVAGGWALGLGMIPLEIVHKLVVIGVLFIPVAAYWVIARRDGWPASVAVTAALLHLFVPGSWLGGGPDELLRMGMWPNVFANYLMLPLMLWSADYLRRDSRRGFFLAACIGSLAVFSNPRALIALAIVLLAVGIVALHERSAVNRAPNESRDQLAPRWRTDIAPLLRRSLLLGTTILLLCAVLLVPLRASQDLYQFERFVEFSSPAKVWEYFSGAIPIELIIIAVIGVLVSIREPRFHTRVLALWLPLAALSIITIGWTLDDLSALKQLEGPRLLPLVRLPALFLAAIGFHWIVQSALRLATPKSMPRAVGVGSVAIVALFILTPVSTLSATERGLPAIETTNQPAFNAIARSAQIYERDASAEDRPLIIGSSISEHASFWIPALTGSNAFHDAWVWYWHTPDYADQTWIADITSALKLDFLRRHGLTTVLVATERSDVIAWARSRPYLRAIDSGTPGGYALFRVAAAGPSTSGPVSVANGDVSTLDVSREHLRATIRSAAPTEVTIAINAFPAWRATVNGADSTIHESVDGYMVVDIPAGDSQLRLDYVVQPAVWVGRALTCLGLLILLAVASQPARRRLRLV